MDLSSELTSLATVTLQVKGILRRKHCSMKKWIFLYFKEVVFMGDHACFGIE